MNLASPVRPTLLLCFTTKGHHRCPFVSAVSKCLCAIPCLIFKFLQADKNNVRAANTVTVRHFFPPCRIRNAIGQAIHHHVSIYPSFLDELPPRDLLPSDHSRVCRTSGYRSPFTASCHRERRFPVLNTVRTAKMIPIIFLFPKQETNVHRLAWRFRDNVAPTEKDSGSLHLHSLFSQYGLDAMHQNQPNDQMADQINRKAEQERQKQRQIPYLRASRRGQKQRKTQNNRRGIKKPFEHTYILSALAALNSHTKRTIRYSRAN